MAPASKTSTLAIMSRPILLVTGANAGVGLGICERLLVQLADPTPSDSGMLAGCEVAGTPFHAGDGCTLILACRNQAKAKSAVAHLEGVLAQLKEQSEIELARLSGGVEGVAGKDAATHAGQSMLRRRFETNREAAIEKRVAVARAHYRASFCKGTVIDLVPLDLASIASTRACAAAVSAKYPYLTHMVLNAGGAAWTGVDWLRATWEMLSNLHKAVTYPSYKLQRAGDKSADGFGWVWQINVGGHYLLARDLDAHLRASPYVTPSRIIWTGSLEASERAFSMDDFQCLDPSQSPCPYESTKYQCELAALGMDERLEHSGLHAPRAYTAHPGIVASSIFSNVLFSFMLVLMKFVFYLVCGTQISDTRHAGHFPHTTQSTRTKARSRPCLSLSRQPSTSTATRGTARNARGPATSTYTPGASTDGTSPPTARPTHACSTSPTRCCSGTMRYCRLAYIPTNIIPGTRGPTRRLARQWQRLPRRTCRCCVA